MHSIQTENSSAELKNGHPSVRWLANFRLKTLDLAAIEYASVARSNSITPLEWLTVLPWIVWELLLRHKAVPESEL
jgi:hypothetical protein